MALISIKADGTVSLSAGVRNRTTRSAMKPLPTIRMNVGKPKTTVGQKPNVGPRKIDTTLLRHPLYEEVVTELRERGIDVFTTKGQSMLRELLAEREDVALPHTSNAPASVTELNQLKDSVASKVAERSETMREINKLERVEALTVEQEHNLNKLKARLVSINSYLDGARKRIANIKRKEKK